MNGRSLKLAVLNHSTVLSDGEVEAATAAVNRQLKEDFGRVWNIAANAHFYGTDPPADHAWVAVLDDADQQGALGYHDLTPDLQPVASVFARTCQQYKASWTVCLSHEAVELAADPQINRLALNPHEGRLYAYETADAVEDDGLGYDIDGVTVSDFVTPDFFAPPSQDNGSAILDYQDRVQRPFQTLPGGYQSYIDLGNVHAGWQQVYGSEPPAPTTDSRHHKRVRASFNQLRRSTVLD